MNNILEIIKYVNNWQNKNDLNFKTLPIDDHACLIFNHKNQIYRFIFSNKLKRDKCISDIPIELVNDYYIIEQEDGLTYYSIIKGDN